MPTAPAQTFQTRIILAEVLKDLPLPAGILAAFPATLRPFFDRFTDLEELLTVAIGAAAQQIKDEPDYELIAARLLLYKIYREVFRTDAWSVMVKNYREGFRAYLGRAAAARLIDPRLLTVYNPKQLAAVLSPERDYLLNYLGLTTLQKRYMLSDRSGQMLETPQYFWLRVAMGLALTEDDPAGWATRFYEKMSQLKYLAAGSTLIGAGTVNPQLSNCYVMEMQDSIDHIGKTVADVMKLTKATGGIGLAVTKLRAEGSPIKKTNTFSSGPIPFVHIIDAAIRAVSRAGKKLGALCLYMENWHLNFPEFLDLKQNSGDEYRRTRTANTAVFLSDEFMRRVENNQDWYLFDPAETPDLNELYGEKFAARYREYVAKADAGQLRVYRKVSARGQFKEILISLQATAHPWLTWKDAINVRALNNNTGTIHLSNLCTEICLPQDADHIAVCNLASINLVRHLTGEPAVAWEELAQSVRLAVRQLDDLVDITAAPVPEATAANLENRAIGLGVMGFTDTLEKMGWAYDSVEAYAFADRLFEFLSFTAIDESANLARARGAYPNFKGSGWAQGLVPLDTLRRLAQARGRPLAEDGEVSRESRLDWEGLRAKVRGGMRNATVLAVAPTASIGLVAGTTTGLDPRFAQMFARTTNYGKFMEVNRNLVGDLKRRQLWDQVKDQVLAAYGDIEAVPLIPDSLKKVYRTSFSIDPHAYIEVAARAQKWIDQALSRNMYLATREIEEMVEIYLAAWRRGLKTTYYLHVKPRHSAEQSTLAVNKAAALGKKGFGALETGGLACPVDPAEREQCESCQ